MRLLWLSSCSPFPPLYSASTSITVVLLRPYMKVGALDVVRMLAISWTGNFIGCALMAGLLRASEIYDHKDTTMLRQVEDKLSHGWGAVLVKGKRAWMELAATGGWGPSNYCDYVARYITVGDSGG